MILRFIVVSFITVAFLSQSLLARNTTTICALHDARPEITLDDLDREMRFAYPDSDGNNGFQLAILHDDVEACELFIRLLDASSGAVVLHKNRDGDSALHLAVRQSNIEVACFLLSLRIYGLFYATNNIGDTATHVAVNQGDLNLVNLLFSHVSSLPPSTVDPCKFFLGGFGYFLLQGDAFGRTPLDLANINRDDKVRRMIESFVAPLSTQCKISPQHFAMYSKKRDYVVQRAKEWLRTSTPKLLDMSDANLFEEMNGMRYLSKEELENYALRASANVLQVKTDADRKCFPNFIYVMAPSGRIYIACEEWGHFHHSSFLAGQSIIGSGHLSFKDGKIREIDNSSGHYLPNVAHLIQTVMKLYDLGMVDANTLLHLVHFGSVPNLSSRFKMTMGELLGELAGEHQSNECKKDELSVTEMIAWSPI